MKLLCLLVALGSSLSYANLTDKELPTLELFNSTAEEAIIAVEGNQERNVIVARQGSSPDFWVFTNKNNCQGGGFHFFDGTPGVKLNFGGPQKSARIVNINKGYHLVLYSGLDQSGTKYRFYDSEENQCFYYPKQDGGWMSLGYYAN